MLCVRIYFAGVSFHDELHCVLVRHAIVGCGVAHCGDVCSTYKSVDVRVIACSCFVFAYVLLACRSMMSYTACL